jgi:hypothetical protein
MKKLVLIASMLAAIGSPGISPAADDHHNPMHGGIMVPGKEADYELVAKTDVVQLYVYDHGKPKDVSKASAKLTLLSGSEKQEVALAPAGDRLEAKGTFKVGPGTKAVAVVTNAGKTLGTARFTLK